MSPDTSREPPAEHATPLTHEGLGITLALPPGWSVASTATFPLQIFGPVRNGYRPNLAFSTERFAPPTREGLAAFVASVRAAQRGDHPGLDEEAIAEIDLDGHPGILQRYSWRPGGGSPPLAQLLALVLVAPGELLEIDAATLGELARETVPLLETTLFSVRFTGRRAAPGASSG